MIILDQYETEPSPAYSGSSRNELVLGEISSDSITRERRVLATRLGGLDSTFQSFNLSYGDRLSFVSGNIVPSITSVRVNRSIGEEEFYFDSFQPSPADIGSSNGVSRPYISGNVAGLFTSAKVSGSELFGRLAVVDNSLHTWFSADGRPLPSVDLTFPAENFADVAWQQSPFPYQARYKNFTRTLRPGRRFASDDQLTEDLNGDDITANLGVIQTSRVGGLFLAWSDPSQGFINWAAYSQAWSVTSSVTDPVDPSDRFIHRPLETWNTLYDVFYNPFTGTSTSGRYVAVGADLTMLESLDGINWNYIAKGKRPGQGAPNQADDLLVINTGSVELPVSNTGSNDVFRIHAEGYASGLDRGLHRLWFLIVGFGGPGSFGGRLVSSTTIGANAVGKSGWSTIDPSGLGEQAAFHDITTTDPGGNLNSSADTLVLVGEDNTGIDSGYIGFSTSKNGSTWNRSTAGVANQSGVIWRGVCSGDTTNNFVFVCGEDDNPFPSEGLIARATRTYSSPHLQTWTDITPTPASVGLATIPVLYDIDYADNGNDLIAVGSGGTILRSFNGGTSWTLRTPPNGYTGRYTRVYADPNNDYWYAVAENDGIHYSDDMGQTWFKADYDLSNVGSAESFVGRGGMVVGSKPVVESSASLKPPQQHVWVDESLKHPWGDSGDSTIIVLRLHDAEFDTSGTVNEAALIEKGKFLSGSLFISPSVRDFNKTYYGFGRGLDVDLSEYQYGGKLSDTLGGRRLGKGILPEFKDFSVYDMYGTPDACTVRLYGPEIRGWKYGIYNGVPTATSVVHRFGKYGQLRDMLEQRQFTAVLDTRNGGSATQFPIDVSFVSGTNVAASASIYESATDTVSFNPFDSGIYDRHYRAGRPFYDTDSRLT